MKKIVFITDVLENPRISKRKKLLEANGYSVVIYGFKRGELKRCPNNLIYDEIGDIGNKPYVKRLGTLYKGIRGVLKKYREENNVIYYLFGLQIATVYSFLSNRKYIYEEADLVHTYFNNSNLKKWFEKKDRKIINNSLLTIFTSEGFVRYHFPKAAAKCLVIPNKLKPEITSLNDIEKTHSYRPDSIQFGFVGGVRFDSTINFIDYVVKKYPQHNFHIYGIVDSKYSDRIKNLSTYDNFSFHGPFKNPNDLPFIYSNIDYVLSTYDVRYENVRYAEPNKLYESIYFRTPIIVSDNTFLSDKVNEYGIGMSVDALDNDEIDKLITSLTKQKYDNLINALESIDRSSAVDSIIDLTKFL